MIFLLPIVALFGQKTETLASTEVEARATLGNASISQVTERFPSSVPISTGTPLQFVCEGYPPI